MSLRITEILNQVGTDPVIALRFLESELEEKKPRKTLVAKLRSMTDRGPLDPPSDLGVRGLELWDRIARSGSYELRPDELAILEEACREVDLIERMNRILGNQPLLVSGSKGQDVANPLVSEIRQHRSALKVLLAQLKLPDDPGSSRQESRSAMMRDVANARWSRGS